MLIGIYYYKDGSFYEGNFSKDKFHGKGKYVWNNDEMYEGGWIDNKFEGFGILFKAGKVYFGN